MALSLQRDWFRTCEEVRTLPPNAFYVCAIGFNEQSAAGFAILNHRDDIQVTTWDEVEANDYWHENIRAIVVSHDCHLNHAERTFIAELNADARRRRFGGR